MIDAQKQEETVLKTCILSHFHISPSLAVDFDSTKMNLLLSLFLCLVASINGLTVEEGSQVVVDVGPLGSDITGGLGNGLSSECEGSIEVILPDNGNLQLFKLTQTPGAHPDYFAEITPTVRIPRMRRARKILVTTGNCCWNFFAKYAYTYLGSLVSF